MLFVSACAPDFQVQGRAYDLQAPNDADPSTPLPLLITLHGYAASGWAQNVVFPFTDVVDSKGVILVRPNGTANSLGKRFWNATDYCCDFDHTGVDDVAFVRALIEDVKSRRAVAEGQVFIVGHSNGGFMALRLACEASDVIDGIVSVAGATWLQEGHCVGGRVIPTLLVHGTADETVLYDGVAGEYPGALETFRRFERRAGCDDGTSLSAEAFDFLGDAEAETTSSAHAGCTRPVELWTMKDVGHVPSFDSRWTSKVIDWLQEKSK
jgi:polyhydroxybutyrate depolymerase